MYQIFADEVLIGKDVTIEDGVILRGRFSKKATRIVIGDNAFIGFNTRTFVDDLTIGDYTKIHNNTFIAGDLPCHIGHCCWIGQHAILNSTGGLTMGNGVGVGAYSQLWSHIAHGDILQGCRWNNSRPLLIEDDVWFVGHCIVSPIHAHEKSMALAGSVVTKDMQVNHVYAGVPAKDVTTKLGTQFADVPLEEKYRKMLIKLNEFYEIHPEFETRSISIIKSLDELKEDNMTDKTVIDISTRSYIRRRSDQEFSFMNYILPSVKFFPSNQLTHD